MWLLGRPIQFSSAMLLLLAAFLGGCPQSTEKASRSKPNFVLIVADTLRNDRLHYAGYPKAQTPAIDGLARESTSFGRAYATASWTLPSVASLFLSQPGFEHQMVVFGAALRKDQVTLVEQLSAAGYETAGFVSNPLLGEGSGFEERFGTYEYRIYPEGGGMELTRMALDWLGSLRHAPAEEKSGKPFFLYLHYMEPHLPYLCAPEDDVECPQDPDTLTKRLYGQGWKFNDQEKKLIRELYDLEVRHLDQVMQALLSGLESLDLENTWILFTSDHGELLGEGGRYTHGGTLVEDLIHVPLLIRNPRPQPNTIDVPVSLVDVAPTILELAGIELPAPFQGRSLAAALRGEELVGEPVLAELYRAKPGAFGQKLNDSLDPIDRLAVINGESKVLLRQDGTIAEFDLAADREEIAPQPVDASRLIQELGDLHGRIDLEGNAEAVRAMDPETLKRLQVLGYVE